MRGNSMLSNLTYEQWDKRASDREEQINPYKRYFFICEGTNTEIWYFEKFRKSKSDFQIHSGIDIIPLRKTGGAKGWSDHKQLFKLANETVTDSDTNFDKERDKIVIVFDTDIYVTGKRKWCDYSLLVHEVPDEYILGVTNPAFELFLLLHKKGSLQEIILPTQENILDNKKVRVGRERIRYIEKFFRDTFQAKPKKDKECIEGLVKDVAVAIEQEREINRDYLECAGKLTSNIGQIMQAIMDDNCE